jgi:hypothetical protein
MRRILNCSWEAKSNAARLARMRVMSVKGAIRKRTQLETKIKGEEQWAKRNKETGQFMDNKEPNKFKGVRREHS